MSRAEKPYTEVPSWRDFARSHANWQAKPLSRRRFMQGMGALSTGLALQPFAVSAKSQPLPAPEQAPWPTIAAVQQQLFPSEADSPGAVDINAASYLKNMMELPRFDTEERVFILQGPTWLNELAINKYKNTFPKLDSTQQETLLQQISSSEAGENWLSLLLVYIFEALLTSPIYGGNPDGTGWRWLEHNPGFPQPSVAHTFPELLKR